MKKTLIGSLLILAAFTMGFVSCASDEAEAAPSSDTEETAAPAAQDYHAYLCLQMSDSWVFRNTFGSDSYGGDTAEFKAGLFDTENALSDDGHCQGTFADATIPSSEITTDGKTYTVELTDFNLNDKLAEASAFNMLMVSTDIPFGTVDVTDAKVYFDDTLVNTDSDGNDIFVKDIDGSYTVINFINIWNKNIPVFTYSVPKTSIKVEFTIAAKPAE